MSRRQRNNIAALHGDLRRIVSRMLYDGATYDDIRAEMAGRTTSKLHNNSFKAWQTSDEYVRYRDVRAGFDAEMAEDQVLATAINDGRGPESVTDLIIMDIIRAFREKTRGAGELDIDTLGGITKALAPVLRNQVAEAKLDADTRLEKAKRDHEVAVAELNGRLEFLREENKRMRDAIDRAGISLESGRPTVDLEQVGQQMDELLGKRGG
ncbi:MAG: hypothetical protein RRC34_02835 [Lentisphaeria bacterium]|nr:hypothetical protein [Lentisphaeria bacterium]